MSLSTAQLTQDGISYLLNKKNKNNSNECPIVQVTNITKVPGSRDKYRVHISDGIYWAYAYLTEHLKMRHDVKKGSIITIDVWNVTAEATMYKIDISKGSLVSAQYPIIGVSTYYEEQQIPLKDNVCYLLHLKLICISILYVICMQIYIESRTN